MDGLQFLKFLLIALAIPTQYLISNYWSNDYVKQNQEIKK